ncbi:hypothetical protein GQ53DRAFT_50721 [Thozetella sp. PMI_491]|nr:hypothetical protein GQ53DRAFT_50721 [Thozetella sp. PMI_491]
MSGVIPTPEDTTPETFSAPPAGASSRPSKPQRVLACVLCQQRKVKCDRRFPCSNCTKSGAQCVPATLTPRQRRRRFPERVLLERLRKYEDILRQNNIYFEPLHGDATVGDKNSPNDDAMYHSDDDRPDPGQSPATTERSERTFGHKSFWRALNQGLADQGYDSDDSYDGVHEVSVRKAWDQLYPDTESLLPGARKSTVDLSTLHPEPVQIFRLWQIYLDNVNPVLKLTHTPTLQTLIIEAAGNVRQINPNLEALMFSIYCVAISSLDDEECQSTFNTSNDELRTRYQFACQEALSNCGYLRTNDLNCLTAFHLYLFSAGISTDPRSLSSMFSIAIRIARRLGLHSELENSKCGTLEAELRRRIWWSLVQIDSRIGEMADYKMSTMSPIFNCRVPLNMNDSDLRAEMKESPAVGVKPTEAIFAVVRAELADYLRHARFYLDFTSPRLLAVARQARPDMPSEGDELAPLEKMIEEKYLRFCDPDNPLHYLTIWATRAYIAKARLVQAYWRWTSTSEPATEADRDTILKVAADLLEADTKILSNPLTKGYRWLFSFYFPFPAYIHVVQDLKRRPFCNLADRCWEVLSDNYDARTVILFPRFAPIFRLWAKTILDGWKAREAATLQNGEIPVKPRIILEVEARLAEFEQGNDSGQSDGSPSAGMDFFSFAMPGGFGDGGLQFGMGVPQGGFGGTSTGTGTDALTAMSAQPLLDVNMSQLDWTTASWGMGPRRGW